MIHADIVKNLETCDMVLCDLSGENPNVFFELGVRTSLDKPIAIVRDEKTRIPFDLGGTNVHPYTSALDPWLLPGQIQAVAKHIMDAESTCAGRNPLWQQYGLTIRAQEPTTNETPAEAKLDLVLQRLKTLERTSLQSDLDPHRRYRAALGQAEQSSDEDTSWAENIVMSEGTTSGLLRSQLQGWSARSGFGTELWVNPAETALHVAILSNSPESRPSAKSQKEIARLIADASSSAGDQTKITLSIGDDWMVPSDGEWRRLVVHTPF